MSDLHSSLRPPPFLGPSRRILRLWVGALLLLLLLLYLWRCIFIPIESGQLGVLWMRLGGGTVMDRAYGEGYRAILPWDRMEVYDIRLQEMHDNIEVLTADGLQVSLGVTVRFAPRPADLPMLHKHVGPLYKNPVVWPDVAEAVRHVVRQFRPDDLRVMGEAGLAAKIDAEARAAVQRHWVDLDRVLITRITLPQRIQADIQEKLAQEQRALAYDYILKQAEMERQRRLIEADGISQFEKRARVSILKWRGIEATERLADSPNAKIVVMGTGQSQLPILLNGDK